MSYQPFTADPGAQENRVDTTNAKRVTPTQVQPKVVSVEGKRFAAVSAHALLDALSEIEGHSIRPGHPSG